MARTATKRTSRRVRTPTVAEHPEGASTPPQIGDNQPTALDAFKAHVDDLWLEAGHWLDGEPITNEEQAEAINVLKRAALAAEKDGGEKRKELTKPLDDAKAEIMEAWRPLVDPKTGRCRMIVDTCNKVLAPWLKKIDDEQKAEAERKRAEAERLAAEALKAHQEAKEGSLEDREHAELVMKEANRAEREADRAEKAKAQAGGDGARATGLRTVWTAVIVNPREALNHYVKQNRQDFLDLIQKLADFEARNGPRTAPGIEFKDEQVAR